MELKFFQFYFLQLLVNRNTYVVENNGMEKKRKKSMRTLFQAESLEFYRKGLPYFNSCEIPLAHSNV